MPRRVDEEPIREFLSLVKLVHLGETARSENDLSSRLAGALRSIGLYTVIDTRIRSQGSRRPDILAYVREQDADLVLPAEVVVESKMPDEIPANLSLSEAMLREPLWSAKTYPYLRDNITRVQYFALTTFVDFAVLHVSGELRDALTASFRDSTPVSAELKASLAESIRSFHLVGDEGSVESPTAWAEWTAEHLSPAALSPLPLSSTRNSIPVRTAHDLERLASQLAVFAAGSGDPTLPEAGLFQLLRSRIDDDWARLDDNIRRDLLLYVMSQQPWMSPSDAQQQISSNIRGWLDSFVAASIHSLLSRFFAIKLIEDAFCVNEEDPLIEPSLWLFATNAYDNATPEAVRSEAFRRIRELQQSANPSIQQFASYSFFFDWIEQFIDPVLFRSLIELFSVHDLTSVEGDLLGRFYELYTQQTNRSRRKALGQYYTPLPIVEYMWHIATQLASRRAPLSRLIVLDPAMGSATFLAEGARVLGRHDIQNFWQQLTGFDISNQILGIAHANLYMAVLSQVTRQQALAVDDLRLYATDSLDYENGHHLREILPLIPDEAHRQFLERRVAISTRAKQRRGYRLVIGNPPYKNNSRLSLSQVAERFPALLQSSVDRGGLQQRNIRDDYAWFVAAADHYVAQDGLICYILSDSFATNRSYAHFREELLKHYQIHTLIRLGPEIFPDVGYRTSFLVILLEKRATALESCETAEAFPYSDLRTLQIALSSAEVGTDADPRLALLRRAARQNEPIPETTTHTPHARSRFSLYPTGDALSRFDDTYPLHERSHADRLFVAKWPGIITAFDALFKGRTATELGDRVSSLFNLVRTAPTSGREFTRRLDTWASHWEITGNDRARLDVIVAQINDSPRLAFDPTNVRRSFSGAIPNEARWHPPAEFVHYLYYEPSLNIPRNIQVGRSSGWGHMNQWRDPRTHLISPKLIYTTANRPRNGYTAFVVTDEWFVKLHGGTSQQFNYTGLFDPTAQRRLDALPDNLSEQGLNLYIHFRDTPDPGLSLLRYIAAIWNSNLAAELLEQSGGSSTRPGIKLPQTQAETGMALEIASLAGRACLLSQLRFRLLTEGPELPDDQIDSSLRSELSDFHATSLVNRSSRFRQSPRIQFSNDSESLISGALEETEAELNNIIEDYYS